MPKLTLDQIKARRREKAIELLGETPVGKWAVFRRSPSAKNIRFVRLHEDRESAVNEARRLTVEYDQDPDLETPVFYVVHVELEFHAKPRS